MLGQPTPGREIEWIIQALREIERASYEEATEVASAYSANDTFTTEREIDVSTPSAANLAAVLASFIDDLKKRGVKRE